MAKWLSMDCQTEEEEVINSIILIQYCKNFNDINIWNNYIVDDLMVINNGINNNYLKMLNVIFLICITIIIIMYIAK